MEEISTRKVTFAEFAEQVARLNRNAMEAMLKMGSILTSEEEEVTFTVNLPNNETREFNVRTLAQLSRTVSRLVTDLESLQGIGESSSAVIRLSDGSSAELRMNFNTEPPDIIGMPSITEFRAINDREMDSNTLPLTYVLLDFSDSMPTEYAPNRVKMRSYKVNFEKDTLGNYTLRGDTARQEFLNQFAGRSNIAQSEFQQWLRTTPGIVQENWADDSYVQTEPPMPRYSGVFSVRGKRFDDSNNRLYYALDKREYRDNSNGLTRSLEVGDVIMPNALVSSTKWIIREVRTINGTPEIYVEPQAGSGTIPTGDDVLRIMSPTFGGNRVRLFINFDSYYCVFLKAINPRNGIESRNYSEGVAFWSNSTTLDSNDVDNGTNYGDYFLNRVVDVGELIRDLARREIPSRYAVRPNTPTVSADQFEVSVTNSHIVNNNNLENEIQRLNASKKQLDKEIQQKQSALSQTRSRLASGNFRTGTKAELQTEVSTLSRELQSLREERQTTSNQLQQFLIEAQELGKAEYQAVAFIEIPEPVNNPRTGPQQVVQFEWEVRKLSKTDNGQIPVVVERTNSEGETITSVESQWKRYQGNMRERTFNPVTGGYTWNTEDEGDLNSQNFNRIDFPIGPGENADVRVRVKSEVQYNSSPLYSEWSEIVQVQFPEELENNFDSRETIEQQTLIDQARIEVESDLERRQVFSHVNEQVEEDGRTFRHPASSIFTDSRDANNRLLSVNERFSVLEQQITDLRSLVTQSVGVLRISIERNGQSFSITPNQKPTEFTLIAENFAVFNAGITTNDVKIIDEFTLVLENTSEGAPVNIISGRSFDSETDSPFYDSSEAQDGQAVWGNFNDQFIIPGDGENLQNDFQWIWLKNNVDQWSTDTSALISSNVNLTVPQSEITPDPILTDGVWSSNSERGFGVTVLPIVENDLFLVEDGFLKRKSIAAGERIEIPIRIYFKFDVNSAVNVISKAGILNQPASIVTRDKSLSFYLEVENQNQPLNWDVLFKVTNFNPNNPTESDFDVIVDRS